MTSGKKIRREISNESTMMRENLLWSEKLGAKNHEAIEAAAANATSVKVATAKAPRV